MEGTTRDLLSFLREPGMFQNLLLSVLNEMRM
jgi:hypothetical protein